MEQKLVLMRFREAGSDSWWIQGLATTLFAFPHITVTLVATKSLQEPWGDIVTVVRV